MPRRNLNLILALTVVGLLCAAKVSPEGRVLTFAMNQISLRYLWKEELDQQRLLEGALEGMVSRLDENSAYILPEEVPEFDESLDREFGGVGIEIVLDPETKQLAVGSPLVGAPAYEAGIRAGDKILRIDGVSTQGLSLPDAAERLRGREGDPVTLTVLHEGEQDPVDVTIVRAKIQIDTVLGDTRNPDGSWNYFLEADDRIGYLRINAFSHNTRDELARAVRWLLEHDMQGLILDLRDNPGGMLGGAIDICDMFLDSGVIVTTRRRDGAIRQEFLAAERGTLPDFPLAVLVNHYSASAAEIVAACFQDHGRAVVAGQRTFGKGTVQEIIDFQADQGKLKLTTSTFWRPSGKNIHRYENEDEASDWGVRPNPGYEVEIDPELRVKLVLQRRRRDVYRSDQAGNASAGETPAEPLVDPQLAKAVQYIKKASGGTR